MRDQIWRFSHELQTFKLTPRAEHQRTLGNRFAVSFTQHPGVQTLTLTLKRLHDTNQELLRVLERPDIPLHDNLSENDIRAYVKKRKISATPSSEAGRAARDIFLSLKQTCQTLGLSFWHYLQDRLAPSHPFPPLPLLISTAAHPP